VVMIVAMLYLLNCIIGKLAKKKLPRFHDRD
jgi:hypothetical protein